MPEFSVKERLSVDVLFVAMPFGPLMQPSIGLNLLKGSLKTAGFSSKILYQTLRFGEKIGMKLYNRISAGRPYQDLVGEWLFSEALFGSENPKQADYVEDILRRKAKGNSRTEPVSDAYIRQLLWVKSQIEAFMDEALAEILSVESPIIGLTSIFQQHVASLAIAKRLKAANPELTIVMGGANCEGTMGAETVRLFPFVDAVVSGEGENIFPQFVKNTLDAKPVFQLQGVFTRDSLAFKNLNGKYLGAPPVRKMDALPYVDYSDYFEQAEGRIPENEIHLPYETSRGCWWGEKHHCTFCGLNGDTMEFRSKSQSRALDELRTIAEKHPEQSIFIVDNILDMRYFKEFIPTLKANPVTSNLFYEVKANLRKDQLQDMVAAGITGIQPGIESLNSHVLELMRKGVSAIQNIQLLKWCKELGMDVSWNMIWGFPGETAEDYAEMERFFPLLTHFTPPIGTSRLRLDRFSPNYEEADSFGFTNIHATLPYHYIYPFNEDSLKNLAYHFNYEYVDGRDTYSYSQPVLKKLNVWKREHHLSALFFVDVDTETRLVWDLRPIAKKLVTVLTGAERDVYELCDKAQTFEALVTYYPDAETAQASLQRLCDLGLMLELEKRFISLALPIAVYAKNLPVIESLAAATEKSSLILDYETELETEGQLTADYFALAKNGKVIVRQEALDSLLVDLSGTFTYTIAGITFD